MAIPFTTPRLAGARLRSVDRSGLEVLLPQVVGRGVGIVPWDRIGLLCSPTLFDRRLGTRLASLPALTPATVRQVICAEAAAGLAGPLAQQAAEAARAADEAEIERARTALPPVYEGSGAANGLASLAALLGPVGMGSGSDSARLPRTLTAVIALADHLGDQQRTGASGADTDILSTAARRTADVAGEALLAARTMAADPVALLRRWSQEPEKVGTELTRAEWLLDGWAWLCGLWSNPDERLGRAAVILPEMAALVPPLPRQIGDAAGASPRQEFPDAIRSLLRGGDWRSGITPQDLIARNESLLAGVLRGPGAGS